MFSEKELEELTRRYAVTVYKMRIISRRLSTDSEKKQDWINADIDVSELELIRGKKFSENDKNKLTQDFAYSHYINRHPTCSEDSSEEEKKDDWFEAKRKIAFFLLEKIISDHSDGRIRCCAIPTYYHYYFNLLTLEEYKKRKAYLLFLNRKDKSSVFDDKKCLQEYYSVCNSINKSVDHCINSSCKGKAGCIAISFGLSLENQIKNEFSGKISKLSQKIIETKSYNYGLVQKTSLEENQDEAKQFVMKVYDDYFLNESKSRTPPSINYLKTGSDIYLINMSEFVCRCFF